MSKIHRTLTVPAFLILGASVLIFAGGGDEFDFHKRADKIVARMEKELALTPDQKVKVGTLAQEVAEYFKKNHEQEPGTHRGFIAQLRSGKVDTAALNREMENHAARFRERHAYLIGKFTELHAILTPEQREKLAKHLEKRREKMKEHWERGMAW